MALALESTRQLLEAALANGVFSEMERRAVQSALAIDGVRPQEVEAALVALGESFDSLKHDTDAREKAIDRFLARLKQRRFSPMESSKPNAEESGSQARSAEAGPQSAPAVPNGLAIQWAGNLGRVAGHDNQYSRGVPEPAYFCKSCVSTEAMVLSAEVYAPGLTDVAEPDYSLLRPEVLTDLGVGPGRVRPVPLDPKIHGRRFGNNLRLQWDIGDEVAKAEAGTYQYQFRFSIDGRQWVAATPAPRRLIVTRTTDDIPNDALVESTLLLKVGEITAGRIGWLGTPVVRTENSQTPQPLPAEVTVHEQQASASQVELAVQVWAPGVSNRADLTAEEHSLALLQLGVRLESPFFPTGVHALRFAGKAGIHEHDDIARWNLKQYLAELAAAGGTPPASGDYPIEIVAGDRKIGVLTLHWVKQTP